MRHCTFCGREMIIVVEKGRLFDQATGQRKPERWLQCPKFPRNGFMALFSGVHESRSADNSLIERTYS